MVKTLQIAVTEVRVLPPGGGAGAILQSIPPHRKLRIFAMSHRPSVRPVLQRASVASSSTLLARALAMPIFRLSCLAMTLIATASASRSQTFGTGWGPSWSNVPSPPTGTHYVKLDAGERYSMGLLSDGNAVAWGVNNYGQTDIPPLPSGVTYVEIAAGPINGLARRSDGELVEWGWRANGVPPLPAGLSYTQVSAAAHHSLALRSDGSVVAWGGNSAGQSNVLPLPAGLTYVEVDAGYGWSVARRSDGSVVAWGLNSTGETNVPPLPPGLTYVQVAAFYAHGMALRSDGSIVGWGANGSGQLNVPSLPSGVAYSQVDAGGSHSVARRSDGLVVAWGNNSYGETNVPAFSSAASAIDVVAGLGHTLTILTADSTYTIAGSGCTGSTSVAPTLQNPATGPIAGEDFTIQFSGIPANGLPLGVFGGSDQLWGAVPLPVDLSAVGAAGCTVYVSPTLLLPLPIGAATSWTVAVPLDPMLLGAVFYQQALVLDQAANALGLIVSDYGSATIGTM